MMQCDVKIRGLAGRLIVRIPGDAGKSLSSRGMVMISGKIEGIDFVTPLEPDGKGGHWFSLPDHIMQAGNLKAGDSIQLVFSQSQDWPEPDLPSDLEAALGNEPRCCELWQGLTVKARWEWIRWVRSTPKEATRKKRIEAALDKLSKGMKRPCCFNSSACTVPLVSKSGVLMDLDD